MSRDLMFQDEILAAVRRAYSAIPAGAGRAMAERFYSDEELATLPSEAVDWSLGVHNPVRHAGLKPGDEVLDIGCGGGIDTVLAARGRGPDRARSSAWTCCPRCASAPGWRPRPRVSVPGVSSGWARWRRSRSATRPIDVVISNGVINLSPRKSRALAEIARVLRPGGRLCVSDLTVEDDLPSEILTSESAWAGCISGALSEDGVHHEAGQCRARGRRASSNAFVRHRRRRALPAVHPRDPRADARADSTRPPRRRVRRCHRAGGQAGRLMSAETPHGAAVTPLRCRRAAAVCRRAWSLWRTGTGPSRGR